MKKQIPGPQPETIMPHSEWKAGPFATAILWVCPWCKTEFVSGYPGFQKFPADYQCSNCPCKMTIDRNRETGQCVMKYPI